MEQLTILPAAELPRPLIGFCPYCGEVLVSEVEYVADRGYLTFTACRGTREQPRPTCGYRRLVL